MDTGTSLFDRGNTFYGPNQTIDTTNYGTSVQLEGQKTTRRDRDPSNPRVLRSQMDVKQVIVRNVSTMSLFAGQVVTWQAGFIGKRVDGLARLPYQHVAGIVDDWLGPQGCRVGDLCWVTVEGPCLAAVSLTSGDQTIAADAIITAGTAANSTGATSGVTYGVANTAGRIAVPANTTFNATQTTDGTEWISALTSGMNIIGRAMSAATTNNTTNGMTALPLLVNVAIR